MSGVDSMAQDDDARGVKRARPAPSGDADLISGLDDDVLLRVLALMPDARDAARAAALSRRWHSLWRRVPTLRFVASAPVYSAAEPCAALERYVSFVNGILARRMQSDCAIENLVISYATDSEPMEQEIPASVDVDDYVHNLKQLMSASIDAVQGWIQYAFQHGLKSFIVDLDFVDDDEELHFSDDEEDDDDEDDYDDIYYGEKGCKKEPEVLLGELPRTVGLETLRLALGGARLRLHTMVKFESLIDLSLERIKVANGGAHLLARLVSSASCPRLQKLRMSELWLPDVGEEMRLEANMLSELWIEDVNALRSLELKTPSLRIFHIDKCDYEVLSVSAPKLEELEFFQVGCPPKQLEVKDELPCVQSLNIGLWSHCHRRDSDYGANDNDINMLLLKHCSSVTCLDTTLKGRKVSEEDVDMINSRIPDLPQITSLIVNVYYDLFECHDFGAAVATLLTRFSNLRHIRLHLPIFDRHHENLGADVVCEHPKHWKSNTIFMAQLQEVELTGLAGTDCELWFMKTMLASAERLRKVAISFNQECQHPGKMGKMDAFKRTLLDEGMQTSQSGAYMFACLK